MKGREWFVAQRDDFSTHRIANQMHLGLMARFHPLHIWIGRGNRVDLASHQPVDPAEHGILFMDDCRHLIGKGRQ
jgi:hypothetical protein